MEQSLLPWHFTGDDGAFRLDNPQRTSYLYFPLVNEGGMMSAVTPDLHGDAKSGQHAFLLPPVSVEDLHETRYSRNFWVNIAGKGAWSAAGCSAAQAANPGEDRVTLDAGLLWQRVTRTNARLGLRAEITNFVPPGSAQVELMKVTISNTGGAALHVTPTAAIPLYGRSADNLRDHRHVTSLLQRARCGRFGVLLRPTLSFDERGHRPNAVTYAVLGAEEDGSAPAGFYPCMEDFVGEGGVLDWPAAVVRPEEAAASLPAGTTVDGYEAMGALRFRDVILEPGDSRSYLLVLAILEPGEATDWGEAEIVKGYCSTAQFEACFARNAAYWQEQVSGLVAYTGDARFDGWLKWVAAQPTLRRLFGNSFLPYHDYGRGGRGWRDLWQDALALLLMESGDPAELLFSSFGGVRLDGSNATIIGAKPGEFKADRNNIPRVWMDHGLWPLTSTRLYLDQSGDFAFLLRSQVYFKDSHTCRCQATDPDWQPEQGTRQCTVGGEVYRGSLLEHILVQHLTAFFNVGEHNIIRLEGADWNDALDMAKERGESAAFTAFYAGNLRLLGETVLELGKTGITELELLEELLPLLDSLYNPVDYNSPAAKQACLSQYFASVSGRVSGRKLRIPLVDLAADLIAKADWLADHLQAQEWIESASGYAWFNGHYDNDGQRLEGDYPDGIRMTLTGQVFELMGGVATDEQARQVMRSADHFLLDEKLGGHRLNTDFGRQMLLNMGRCFGFAYGHKENGAVFSHMAVMYAYALYARGFGRAGYEALNRIYRQCCDFDTSRMYPGIPEYFSPRGRGLYPYLTGSASWYLLTLATRAFGARGLSGDLLLAPMLAAEQFDSCAEASLKFRFAGRRLEVVYHNPQRLHVGAYHILSLRVDGEPVKAAPAARFTLPRATLLALDAGQPHVIEVELG